MQSLNRAILIVLAVGCFLATAISPVAGQEVLRYSSSAQVSDVFKSEGFGQFTKQTGISVDLFVGSSASAVHRLFSGVCDIASTAEMLAPRHSDYGYVQTPFCKVPLIVITHPQTPVNRVSEDQLRGIFAGEITNWKELGGPDHDIIVVVPGKETAAFRNFTYLALKRFEVKYDFMTYRSTMVVEAVRWMPWSISFIAKGMGNRDAGVKILNLDGKSYTDAGYPFWETFAFVTKGEPQGAAKALIDYAMSPENKKKMKANGIMPLTAK